MKLTLGCGWMQLTLPPNVTSPEGWVTVDIRPEIQPDIVADFTRLDEYVDRESADAIYSCHSLEHVDREWIYPALFSWWRVLKPGGQLIIRLPNFPHHVKKWLDFTPQEQMFSGLDFMYGPGRDSQFHLNGFSVFSLQRYAEMAGYQVVSCEEYESRYGVPNGDILFHGIKQNRCKKNPNQWVPICAWKPQPFSQNFQMLSDFSLTPFFHVLKKKYSKNISFYQDENNIYCKKEPSGQILLGHTDPTAEIQQVKDWIEKRIDASTQAVIVFGDSLHFIPALLQTRLVNDGLPVVMIDPEIERLAASLALFDLKDIPHDGRWQFIPHMMSQQDFESIFTRMGLPSMRVVILVDPQLAEAAQIGRQFNQMLVQQRSQLAIQTEHMAKTLQAPVTKPRVLLLAYQYDCDARRIGQQCVNSLQRSFNQEAAIFFLQQRGRDREPDLGMIFHTGELIDVIHRFKPTKIICIGVSPLECFSIQVISTLRIPLIFMHTSSIVGPLSAHPSFQTVVTEQQSLPILNRMGNPTAHFLPLACDVDISGIPHETEKIVVFCQDVNVMTAWQKMKLFSLFSSDRETQTKLAGLPFALKDETNVNLYAYVLDEFPSLKPPVLFQVLDYLHREISFLRQCEILRALIDLPLRIHGFGWKDVLSDDDPLQGCIEDNPTTTFNFQKLKRARVALNIPSLARNTGPNGWFFRIPAMGVAQVCDFRPAFETMLPDVAFFHSPEECVERVREHLSNPVAYKDRILSCQEKIRQQHNYAHRLQDLFAFC